MCTKITKPLFIRHDTIQPPRTNGRTFSQHSLTCSFKSFMLPIPTKELTSPLHLTFLLTHSRSLEAGCSVCVFFAVCFRLYSLMQLTKETEKALEDDPRSAAHLFLAKLLWPLRCECNRSSLTTKSKKCTISVEKTD